MRFDDAWFIQGRARLLRPCGHPNDEPRHPHLARSILHDSRLPGGVAQVTEQAIARLAPRHQGAVRGHMQMYRAALEAIGFLPADAIVNASVQIEWLWYTTPFKSSYRDHLAHVMKVALLGLDLLETAGGPLAQSSDKPAISWIARDLAERRLGSRALRTLARRCGNHEVDDPKHSERFWHDALIETVRIAGLLHDLAYPDVMAAKVERAAMPARSRAPFEPSVEDTCRHATAILQHHLVAIPFHHGELAPPEGLDEASQRVVASIFKESHSLRAGYTLLRILDDAKRTGAMTPFDAFVMEWAALATAMHDFDKMYDGDKKYVTRTTDPWLKIPANKNALRPSFKNDPASFIVALADQLQDFGRMNYDTHISDSNTAAARVGYPWEAVEVDGADSRSLIITFILGRGDKNSCFGLVDEDKVKEKAVKKHDEPAFKGKDGVPWLDTSGLVDSVHVKVKHGEQEYDLSGARIPAVALP
jgi:hypothetical protein